MSKINYSLVVKEHININREIQNVHTAHFLLDIVHQIVNLCIYVGLLKCSSRRVFNMDFKKCKIFCHLIFEIVVNCGLLNFVI